MLEAEANKTFEKESRLGLNLEEALLNSYISGLGSSTALRFKIDSHSYEEEISELEAHWQHYNPRKPNNNRFGMSLTSLDGAMDGIGDLDSIYEFNKIQGTEFTEQDFKVPTAAFRRLNSLAEILSTFDTLGRTHILRLNQGGFFPPHRDSFARQGNCFRVLVPLSNTGRTDWAFLLEDQKLKLDSWNSYFIHTLKEHSVFSFKDRCEILVMNVPLTSKNVTCLIKSLEVV